MEKDLDVDFEVNPKLQALTEILDGLTKKKNSSKGKRGKLIKTVEPVQSV